MEAVGGGDDEVFCQDGAATHNVVGEPVVYRHLHM